MRRRDFVGRYAACEDTRRGFLASAKARRRCASLSKPDAAAAFSFFLIFPNSR
jgi:hypothetical protein